jgi:hypothetical protein
MAANKIGRPTKYSDDLANEICSQLSEGKSLVTVCKPESMPHRVTIFRWFDKHPEFRNKYDAAKDESADYLVEEMVDIADNQTAQPVLVDGIPLEVGGKIVLKSDAAGVAHARLRIDTRKWYASKLKPKKYGDGRQDLESAESIAKALIDLVENLPS